VGEDVVSAVSGLSTREEKPGKGIKVDRRQNPGREEPHGSHSE
jgi:hypothetical protein